MQIQHTFVESKHVMPHARLQRNTTPQFQRTLGLSQGTSPRYAGDKSLMIGMAGSESHSAVMATLLRPTRFIVIGR